MKILFIDNFDSFTYNLVQYFLINQAEVKVFRNNQKKEILYYSSWADGAVISPGPKRPQDAGFSLEFIEKYMGNMPILGVCLGMQAINEVYGGQTTYAPLPYHGKKSLIKNRGKNLFAGLPYEFFVARYHSLMLDIKSNDLTLDAWTDDNVPMAITDKEKSIYGVQFHPESFLSEYGLEMIANFLRIVDEFTKN